jgi:hypothetical protein
MKRYIFVLLGCAAPSLAQTSTDCRTIGMQTNCVTDQRVDPAAALLQRTANPLPLVSEPSNEAAAERRSRAYAQVGDLIAKGDCPAAKRLATFYGHRDIVKDTAKACP